MSDRKTIQAAVIGAGPAGLMAAEILAADGAAVTVYDRMPTPARKLLIAGRGGLNLTHSEPLDLLLARYRGSLADDIKAAVDAFTPEQLRAWCEALGQETFVGSSGRVFPRAMKASPLLRAWLKRLDAKGVRLKTRYRWVGFGDGDTLLFETPVGLASEAKPDVVVLALGGASWPHLGSDGAWVDVLEKVGTPVAPLVPANSGFQVPWSAHFRDRFAGLPLKRIAVSFAGHDARGEAMITHEGLEGGVIYALSSHLRDAMSSQGSFEIAIDLKPDVALQALDEILSVPRGKASLATILRKKAHLSPQAIGLLQEAAHRDGVALQALDGRGLAARMKHVTVTLSGVASILRAISSGGGVMSEGVDQGFMLRAQPGVFVAGEMLDWEAPTGGYLLQASFATGVAAARSALAWVRGDRAD